MTGEAANGTDSSNTSGSNTSASNTSKGGASGATGGAGIKPPSGAASEDGTELLPTQLLPTASAPAISDACGHDSYRAERIGVNLYLLVDASGSMREPIDGMVPDLVTRWDAVRGAIEDFVGSPESDDLGLALAYFPIHTERSACSDTSHTCPTDSVCVQTVCDLSQGLLGITFPCTPGNQRADMCKIDGTLKDGTAIREQCVTPGVCSGDATRLCILDPQGTLKKVAPAWTSASSCAAGETCKAQTAGVCPGVTSCDSDDYSTPAVPLATLPKGTDAILASLKGIEPDDFSLTPTHIALRGAYSSVSQWIDTDPTRRSVVVLATDGEPNGCQEADNRGQVIAELDDTITALSTGNAAGIQTFVIGVLDPEATDLPAGTTDPVIEARANLNRMAKAGGGGNATFVTSNDTTAKEFLAALDRIRGSVLPCEFKLPESSGALAYDKVNVQLTRDGNASITPKVTSDKQCGATEGWYYDSDASGKGSPTEVVLCPASCTAANAGGNTLVDILVGCKTVVSQVL